MCDWIGFGMKLVTSSAITMGLPNASTPATTAMERSKNGPDAAEMPTSTPREDIENPIITREI